MEMRVRIAATATATASTVGPQTGRRSLATSAAANLGSGATPNSHDYRPGGRRVDDGRSGATPLCLPAG